MLLLHLVVFRTQETFQCDPDSYNGAVRENYSWSQDYTDVEVRVLVPETVVKGRQVKTACVPTDVSVLLSSQSLQLCLDAFAVLRSASVCSPAACEFV